MYISPHSSPGGVPFPWARTGTTAAVYSYIRTAVLYCFFFVSAIETLIVVACHVLFVTTVWISENELRESINIIIMMLISAPFPWVRTGSAAAVYSFIRTAVLYC